MIFDAPSSGNTGTAGPSHSRIEQFELDDSEQGQTYPHASHHLPSHTFTSTNEML
jgi:hypothetical protein